MKGTQIALDHLNGQEAAALMVDGRLQDVLVDSDMPRPGTIYRAIANRPMKGQGGMFVTTPDGNAFLRQIKGLSPGQTILCQVTGYGEPGKAIPVTARLLFKSRYAIVTPDAPGLNISRSIRDEARRDALLEIAHGEMGGDTMGLILRSASVEAADGDIAEDIRAMRALALAVLDDVTGEGAEVLTEGDAPHALAWRDWSDPADVVTDPGCFETLGVLDQIDALASDQVPLSGGGSMYIEPTRALVAVDVNTGGDTSPAAGLKVNAAAAKELPRQLRLRGLGGQITLDLAPMPKKDRKTFENALRSALRADRTETALVGWTPLGHYELHRKRDRIPLKALMK